MKCHQQGLGSHPGRRSREGAWIEMSKHEVYQQAIRVAPVRERGLKSGIIFREPCSSRRSRKGAWIEIAATGLNTYTQASRSREGAWIEILLILQVIRSRFVAPVRERGLKYNLHAT